MSKVLIAVVTCKSRVAWADTVRKTWAKKTQPNVDVEFFVGAEWVPGTTSLNCDDSYQGLPSKVREIVKYALENGYDYVLKCDDDVVLDLKNILASDFSNYDFVGHESSLGSSVPHGFNYWLSKKSMEILRNAQLPTNNNDEAWVTSALLRYGIALHHDARYRLHMGPYLLSSKKRALRKPQGVKPLHTMYFAWCLHNKTVTLQESLAEFVRLYEATQEA